jgi:hypothetical protein
MSFQHKPGHGSLFRNDKKSKDVQPDYKGSLCLPDGSTVQIAGWISTKADGSKYLALKANTALPPQGESE